MPRDSFGQRIHPKEQAEKFQSATILTLTTSATFAPHEQYVLLAQGIVETLC